MEWTEVALPILLAVIAAIPGIAALFRGRKKEKADVATAITDAAHDLLGDYRAQIDEIKQTITEQAETIRCQERKIEAQARNIAIQQLEIDALRAEQEEFLTGVNALCAQIRGLGHEPVWEPE